MARLDLKGRVEGGLVAFGGRGALQEEAVRKGKKQLISHVITI